MIHCNWTRKLIPISLYNKVYQEKLHFLYPSNNQRILNHHDILKFYTLLNFISTLEHAIKTVFLFFSKICRFYSFNTQNVKILLKIVNRFLKNSLAEVLIYCNINWQIPIREEQQIERYTIIGSMHAKSCEY